MASDEIPPDLLALAQQLNALREQARELGLFTNDRELLTCPSCGLQEDVTIDGLLITYDKDSLDACDSTLRFSELREDLFLCPRCGTHIAQVEVDPVTR